MGEGVDDVDVVRDHSSARAEISKSNQPRRVLSVLKPQIFLEVDLGIRTV